MARETRVRDDGFRLPADVASAMQADLQHVAGTVVAAVIGEVPSYSEPFRGRMGRTIETAVAMALGGFLDLATSAEGIGPGTRVESVFEAAYALGRGEARSGRTMDALTSAYRVGARTAWRDMSAIAVANGLEASDLARFAELVFDYIDQLSAVSVSGHADELATTGRVRQRYLDRLASSILAGETPAALESAAEKAEWSPPRTLTAVILPESAVGSTRSQLDARTLQPAEESPGLEGGPELAVLLVPDAGGRSRGALLRTLEGRGAVVGPARPWLEAQASYQRALRARALGLVAEGETVDTEEHLATIVLRSDPAALADLRARALAPLADLRPATAEKLEDTLRSWLLHQGRREEVAAALFVHPQTVRYRMGQLRELYGDRLDDPVTMLELTIALGPPTRQ
ncbi:CdaR family transcriptional regulator [Nocardioides sp.]|uniref:PucR family transcriptional regulator n=1 Tax=Nocardioides sp. TaxID=35761 RepID=UPI002737215D|nr:PucR family transcriptional regulator [Nocardioides sp.]MDP3893832.1 helix-turn-helix domain-containing protein [Nocardioides sp.]